MLRTIIILLISLISLGAAAQEKFTRGIEQINFIPRGQWITGINVNYSQNDVDNYQFLIVENLSGDTYSFKISPLLMYAFRENLAAGGRFAYTRQRTRLNSSRVVIDSETDYDPGQLYAVSHSYTGSASFRNYFSVGNSMRFGFFNELQLAIGGGQTKIVNSDDEDITGTYSRNFSLDLGLTPGFLMFLNNYSAIEVSVGVLGFSYNHSHDITNQVYIADSKSKSANFRINLFSISFGAVFYL